MLHNMDMDMDMDMDMYALYRVRPWLQYKNDYPPL